DGLVDLVVRVFADVWFPDLAYKYHGLPGFDVYYGSSSGAIETGPLPLVEPIGIYSAVGNLGDIDADGYDDLLFLVRDDGPVGLIRFGTPDGIDTLTPSTYLLSPSAFEDVGVWGYEVAHGDINGDGYSDFAISGYDGFDYGHVYIYYGFCTDRDRDTFCAPDDCDDHNPDLPVVYYYDNDGDSYTVDAASCDGPPAGNQVSAPSEVTDCDDSDPTLPTSYYPDADGDGYTAAELVVACDPDHGQTKATEADCDDDDATVYPGAEDVAGDGIDQDCDGATPLPLDDVHATVPGDTGGHGEGRDGKAAGKWGCSCTSGPAPSPPLWLLPLVAFRRRRSTGDPLR
ncbi:MAG: MopE-related protein, partial [Acidimicrobiia bacterium]|nr:MopE-related protein [Acidimicrobiia bacterium]